MLQCGRDIPSFPDARFVKEIFSGTYLGTGVRELMVDLWVWKADVDWVGADDPTDEVNKRVARMLCPALMIRSRPYVTYGIPWENSERYYDVEED
jgi:hypothetical protein